MSNIPKAFFNVSGINFGSLIADKEQLFAIQVFNPVTNKKSDLFTFHYKNHNNFHQKFSVDIVNLATQNVIIYLHRVNSLFNHKLAKVIIPLSAFPENKLCHEVVEMQSKKKHMDFPFSIVFDMHVNTECGPAFKAPVGESRMKFFDTTQYLVSSGSGDIYPNNKKGIRAAKSQPLLGANYF